MASRKVRDVFPFCVALAINWSLAVTAGAQEPGGEAGVENAPTVSPGAPRLPDLSRTGPMLTVINAGDVAPFSGLLLSDERYAVLKLAELERSDAEFRVEQERRARKDLQVVLDSCLLLDEEDGGEWYETFWAGAVFGVGAAILVGWLGYKVIE
jgi:hypothetical protein